MSCWGGSLGSFPWTVLQVLSRPPGLKHLATLPRQLGFQDFTRPWEASRPGQLSKRQFLSAALTKLAMGIQSWRTDMLRSGIVAGLRSGSLASSGAWCAQRQPVHPAWAFLYYLGLWCVEDAIMECWVPWGNMLRRQSDGNWFIKYVESHGSGTGK